MPMTRRVQGLPLSDLPRFFFPRNAGAMAKYMQSAANGPNSFDSPCIQLDKCSKRSSKSGT